MSRLPNLREIVLRDTPFARLMTKRIYNVLLIATRYDAFTLEDDGRVDELIFNEGLQAHETMTKGEYTRICFQNLIK